LPAGIFLPYSAVKTSIIFFDKTKPTQNIWFYEVPLIEGKKLTKKSGITGSSLLLAELSGLGSALATEGA